MSTVKVILFCMLLFHRCLLRGSRKPKLKVISGRAVDRLSCHRRLAQTQTRGPPMPIDTQVCGSKQLCRQEVSSYRTTGESEESIVHWERSMQVRGSTVTLKPRIDVASRLYNPMILKSFTSLQSKLATHHWPVCFTL